MKYPVIKSVLGSLAIAGAVFISMGQISNPGILWTGANPALGDCIKAVDRYHVTGQGTSCGAAAPVQSVFGRIGNVVATLGDYSFSLISGQVTTAQITDANVTTVKIADANVTTLKIADANVTAAKLAIGAAASNVGTLGGVLGGTLPNPSMAVGAAASNVGALGADLSGTLPNPTVAKVQGLAYKSAATYTDGQVPTWVAANSQFEPVTPTGASWQVMNLTGQNNALTPATKMDWTADWVTLWSPSLAKSKTINQGSVTSQTNDISVAGPTAGGRDQALAFAAGNDVWFYYIWSTTLGLSNVSSLNSPTAGGPSLPAGYTYWAPAFLLKVGPNAVTLNPILPQGGSTTYKIRGDRVFLANTPFITGTTTPKSCGGYPTGTCDLSAFVPQAAKTVTVYIDYELSCATSCIAGIVLSTTAGNFYNASLYPTVSGIPYAANGYINDVVLNSNQTYTFTYSISSGTASTSPTYSGPASYTFGTH